MALDYAWLQQKNPGAARGMGLVRKGRNSSFDPGSRAFANFLRDLQHYAGKHMIWRVASSMSPRPAGERPGFLDPETGEILRCILYARGSFRKTLMGKMAADNLAFVPLTVSAAGGRPPYQTEPTVVQCKTGIYPALQEWDRDILKIMAEAEAQARRSREVPLPPPSKPLSPAVEPAPPAVEPAPPGVVFDPTTAWLRSRSETAASTAEGKGPGVGMVLGLLALTGVVLYLVAGPKKA